MFGVGLWGLGAFGVWNRLELMKYKLAAQRGTHTGTVGPGSMTWSIVEHKGIGLQVCANEEQELE